FSRERMRPRRLFRRRTMHAIAAVLVTLGALVLSDLVSVTVSAPASDRPPHHGRRGFRNVDPDYTYSVATRVAHVIGRPPAQRRGARLVAVGAAGDARDDGGAGAAFLRTIGTSR